MTQHFFVTKDIRKIDGEARVIGQIITDGTVTVSDGGGSGGSKPPIKPVGPFEPKWILPPVLSPESQKIHDRIKGLAEGMGYETLEHDDFSYPPAR